LAVV